jgi:hypothetical protein
VFRAAAVVSLVVGIHEEDVDGEKDGSVCNRAWVVPEEDVVGKKLPL